MAMRAADEVNQEESWHHRWGDAYLKEWLVICNDEDTDGPGRVTADEERVYM